MKKLPYGFIFCFLIPIIVGCTPIREKQIRIALTKASPNYINWIKKGDSSVIVVDLSNLKPAEAIQELNRCAGLVLTGGGDIDPALYKNDDKNEMCTDIDRDRDRLERSMIGEALSLKMPILGICRGEQILNVVMGGSLITDIPSYKKLKNHIQNEKDQAAKETVAVDRVVENKRMSKKEPAEVIHQCKDYLHCYHAVRLDPKSLLRSIIGSDTGFVTTNHHQAILALGKGLKKNAQSADSIVEGIEWNDAREKSFMVGVQWHPERMDTSNAFSGRILQYFLTEIKKYASTAQKVE